jgi:hypothetical protein
VNKRLKEVKNMGNYIILELDDKQSDETVQYAIHQISKDYAAIIKKSHWLKNSTIPL